LSLYQKKVRFFTFFQTAECRRPSIRRQPVRPVWQPWPV